MFRQGSLKVELEDAQVTTDVFFLLDTCVVLFGHGQTAGFIMCFKSCIRLCCRSYVTFH